MSRFLMVIGLVTVTLPAWSQTLSARSVYERCYAKLVRTTPDTDDPFLAKITAGAITGPQACKELLRLAQFTSGGQIPLYSNDPAKRKLAQRVLQTMHELHTSWFAVKEFPLETNGCFKGATSTVVDAQEPALFFTRALFDSSYNIASAVTGNQGVRAIRSVDDPSLSTFAPFIDKQITGFPSTFKWTPNGELTGVSAAENPVVTKLTASALAPGETGSPPTLSNHRPLANLGGGLLGSQAYLLNNFGDKPGLFPNLEQLPRQWAKYVFRDLLCRELPVVEKADVTSYVSQKANALAFRKDTSCLQCHVSMDQLAGVVRNFRNFRSDNGTCRTTEPKVFSSVHLVATQPSLSLDKSWGASKDDNYRKRPAFGRLVFRAYDKSALRDYEFTSLAQLGQVIATTDEFYICAAKRYYRYLTGIDVDVSPMSAAETDGLPPDRKFYRNRVIQLGRDLKNDDTVSKDPMKLIERIFDLPEYSKRDLDLRTKAGG